MSEMSRTIFAMACVALVALAAALGFSAAVNRQQGPFASASEQIY